MLNGENRLPRTSSFHGRGGFDSYSVHFDIEGKLRFSAELKIAEIRSLLEVDCAWC
jgi:hypothetical protein